MVCVSCNRRGIQDLSLNLSSPLSLTHAATPPCAQAAMDWLVVGEEQAQRPHVLCGWQSAVALLAVLATALLLATMCWR